MLTTKQKYLAASTSKGHLVTSSWIKTLQYVPIVNARSSYPTTASSKVNQSNISLKALPKLVRLVFHYCKKSLKHIGDQIDIFLLNKLLGSNVRLVVHHLSHTVDPTIQYGTKITTYKQERTSFLALHYLVVDNAKNILWHQSVSQHSIYSKEQKSWSIAIK